MTRSSAALVVVIFVGGQTAETYGQGDADLAVGA